MILVRTNYPCLREGRHSLPPFLSPISTVASLSVFRHRRSPWTVCLTTLLPPCACPEEPPCTEGACGPADSCHTWFLCQNHVLIVCMTQNQLFHTYGPKVFTENQMSRIKYNYYISNVSKDYDDS
jgi:hypothetical protein